MVPSTGIEPVAFPMSRERATAAPTGRKSTQIVFVGAFPRAGTYFVLQALRQPGVKLLKLFSSAHRHWREPIIIIPNRMGCALLRNFFGANFYGIM